MKLITALSVMSAPILMLANVSMASTVDVHGSASIRENLELSDCSGTIVQKMAKNTAYLDAYLKERTQGLQAQALNSAEIDARAKCMIILKGEPSVDTHPAHDTSCVQAESTADGSSGTITCQATFTSTCVLDDADAANLEQHQKDLAKAPASELITVSVAQQFCSQ